MLEHVKFVIQIRFFFKKNRSLVVCLYFLVTLYLSSVAVLHIADNFTFLSAALVVFSFLFEFCINQPEKLPCWSRHKIVYLNDYSAID